LTELFQREEIDNMVAQAKFNFGGKTDQKEQILE